MKKIIIPLLFLPAVVFAESKNNIQPAPATYNVSQITTAKWSEQNGLHYKQVPGFNLGVTSFALLDKNRIAFLSDVSNEIVIKSQSSDSILARFPASSAPAILFDHNGNFYYWEKTRLQCTMKKAMQ